MNVRVRLPKIGDTSEYVVVLEVLCGEGDLVTADEPILLVETDKAQVEVVAGSAGRVAEVLAVVGSEIAVGEDIFVIEVVDG